jgi:c-di-GMP-binding flagellar brake protein YcgR
MSVSLEAKPVPVGTAGPEPREGTMSLDQIRLSIGDPIQLQYQSSKDQIRCFVTLIGYLEGRGIIVTNPVVDGNLMLVREGQHFVARLFCGKSAYAFTTSARRITSAPYTHIHLEWPREVRGMVVRQAARSRIRIICSATRHDGLGHACIVRDISMGGALIAASENLGQVDDPLTLKFRVTVGTAEHMLSLACKIRSLNVARATAEDKTTLLYGLAFERMSDQHTLVISALLYQLMISAQALEGHAQQRP